MKRILSLGLKASCAVLVAAGMLSQPAVADCPAGDVSLFFGNLGGGNVRVNLGDPSAFVHTYIFENAAINQGTAARDTWVFDLGDGTAVVFGDWSGGSGFAGCPYTLEVVTLNRDVADENVHQVLVAGDKDGATLVVAKAGTSIDFPRDINFDAASPTGGGTLPTTTLKPRVISARTGASVTVELAWDPPVINQDSGSTAVGAALIAGYGIIERRYSEPSDPVLCSTGTLMSTAAVPDADGSLIDNHALVVLAQAAGVCSTLSVQANLGVGGGTAPAPSFTGVASNPIRLTPGLAVPGKGKGLLKAPGQQK